MAKRWDLHKSIMLGASMSIVTVVGSGIIDGLQESEREAQLGELAALTHVQEAIELRAKSGEYMFSHPEAAERLTELSQNPEAVQYFELRKQEIDGASKRAWGLIGLCMAGGLLTGYLRREPSSDDSSLIWAYVPTTPEEREAQLRDNPLYVDQQHSE